MCSMSRSQLDALTDRAKKLGAAGLVWMRVGDQGALDSPVAKFLSEAEQLALADAMGAEAGDLLLLVAGDRTLVNRVLGTLRLELGRPPVTEGGLHFLWVVDFPLFEAIGDDGRPVPAHHPFTMPHADDLSLLESATGDDLLKVRSQAYDLVLNGWELGSGSVRIHRRDVQERIFSLRDEFGQPGIFVPARLEVEKQRRIAFEKPFEAFHKRGRMIPYFGIACGELPAIGERCLHRRVAVAFEHRNGVTAIEQ